MFEAAIFDMDGTMADTEIVQSQAFEKILQEHGATPTYTEHGIVHTPGLTSHQIWERLQKEHNLDASVEELTARKRAAVMEVLRAGLEPMEGLIELIEELDSHGIPLGIATSAKLERAQLMLEKINVAQHFSAIASADDVKHVKPAPDSYLAATNALHVNPAHCVAFEDTDVGVTAAKAAGLRVVAIPNKYTQNMDFSEADLVIPSLTEARVHMLAKMFA